MRRIFLLLMLAAGGASAGPIDALQPMSFLAGHCWKGNIPATASTDEHCFEWVLNGHVIRDTHVVRTAGKPDYRGETTYYWSPIANAIEYLYLENAGGMSRGTMETVANTLYFPPAQDAAEAASNGVVTYRTRWSPSGAKSFDAWAEKRGPDGTWQTMFKMTMTRVAPAEKARKAPAKAKKKARARTRS